MRVPINRNFNLRSVMNIFLLMGNVSNTDYPVSWQLKCCWSPHKHHRQLLFLNERDGNFQFEFCNNIENKFNGGISCITPSVVLHAYIRRSKILLTFTWHQVMHSVFCIVPCVEVPCKGLFLIQKHSEQQGQALVFNHSQIVLDICSISECAIITFIRISLIGQLC